MATIIILNGTSSSGKTTLAKALQAQFAAPYLHIGIDHFVFMLPKQYLNQPLWADVFRYQYDDAGHIQQIVAGALGHQLMSTMHHAIKAAADRGFDVIVDHVLLEEAWTDEIRSLFTEHRVWWIGLHCPLDVLEQRERDRQDRTLGQARAQYDVVHRYVDYDLEVDTARLDAQAAAIRIRQHVLGTS